MIQPKVDSLHEPACDVTVVVLNKNNASFQTCFATEPINLLDQRFACFIAWMCFASENELHRAGGIVRQSFQSFLVAEQKCAAFVSREPSCKADGQNFRIKNTVDAANRLRRFTQSFAALSFAVANKIDKA